MDISDFHLKADYIHGEKIKSWGIFFIDTNERYADIKLCNDDMVEMNFGGNVTKHFDAKEAYYAFGNEISMLQKKMH